MDPLKMLREFALEGKEIREENGFIIFEDQAFEKHVKTNFKVYGKASEYYDLQSIYFFYQHANLIHTAYVKEAASNHIQPITRPDRKDLTQYLTKREAKPPASIDVTVPAPVPKAVGRSVPAAAAAPAMARGGAPPSGAAGAPDSEDPAAKERLERILDPSRTATAPTENIRGLSTELTADKVKELKMKALTRRRGQIQNIAEEEVAPTAAEEAEFKGRERVWRTRTTILEASNKNFAKSIFPILQAVKAREEGRAKAEAPASKADAPAVGQKRKEEGYNRYAQDKYRKEETAGFQIDTVGSFHGMTLKSVTEGAAKSLRPVPAPSAPSSTSSAMAGGGGGPKKRVSRTPIIVIPATTNSLITMYNAKDILQELRFVATEEKRAKGVSRANEVLVARQKAGVSVPYRVVDNPLKLGPEEWERVVAVFVQGPAWQFKGWPHNANPVEIFANICAFHLKFEDATLEPNVSRWAVHVLSISRTKRHLDRANLLRLWQILDNFIAKHKSHLRS